MLQPNQVSSYQQIYSSQAFLSSLSLLTNPTFQLVHLTKIHRLMVDVMLSEMNDNRDMMEFTIKVVI